MSPINSRFSGQTGTCGLCHRTIDLPPTIFSDGSFDVLQSTGATKLRLQTHLVCLQNLKPSPADHPTKVSQCWSWAASPLRHSINHFQRFSPLVNLGTHTISTYKTREVPGHQFVKQKSEGKQRERSLRTSMVWSVSIKESGISHKEKDESSTETGFLNDREQKRLLCFDVGCMLM